MVHYFLVGMHGVALLIRGLGDSGAGDLPFKLEILQISIETRLILKDCHGLVTKS